MKITDSNSVKIAKDMYGLFFEDINYSLDGGLYAQMLENRNFEALFAFGKKDDFGTVYDGGYGWSIYEDKGAGSSMYFGSENPLNEVNPHYMVFEGKGETPAFTNKAYDGIYADVDVSLKVSFYAFPVEGSRKVTLSIVKNGKVLAAETVEIDSDEWKKYECTLKVSEKVEQGDFVVSLKGAGVMKFDWFSMMPEDAVLGIFRKDLVDKLVDLYPSFMRFPGGCIVEGNTLDNRYRWKDTIAPVEERKYNWNRWAVHNNTEKTGFSGPYPHYGQTYGVGYYEYFLLCEYMKAKPLPVMNVGLACQFMSSELVDVESAEMEEYIQDALDLMEFANGDVNTTWGKKRAQMGHPEPFNLEYLGVGNEQWETEKVTFFKRYEMFEKRLHEAYPEVKLIGTSGPDVWSDGYHAAWEWAKKVHKENSNIVYAMDEHYYVSPEWLYDHVHFYDAYDRDIKVFAGEYACHIPGLAGRMNCPEANTLEGAIAEAAFMTGIERNADVVTLASYAPLFARYGYTQWSPNLIWFDGGKSYTTPSYYVQQLYSKYRGVRTLNVDMGISTEAEKEQGVYASAVEDADGCIIIKIVNAGKEEKELELDSELIEANAEYICECLDGENVKKTSGKLLNKKIRVTKCSFSVIIISK